MALGEKKKSTKEFFFLPTMKVCLETSMFKNLSQACVDVFIPVDLSDDTRANYTHMPEISNATSCTFTTESIYRALQQQ